MKAPACIRSYTMPPSSMTRGVHSGVTRSIAKWPQICYRSLRFGGEDNSGQPTGNERLTQSVIYFGGVLLFRQTSEGRRATSALLALGNTLSTY